MTVLVDTPIWSLLFRRHREQLNEPERARREELKSLLRDDRALLLGPIRQELLTGIRELAVFERLRDRLRGVRDEPLTTADFEAGARSSNICRAAGNSGSGTDYLLCAVAARLDCPIYTTDGDFHQYSRHLPFRLHRLPEVE